METIMDIKAIIESKANQIKQDKIDHYKNETEAKRIKDEEESEKMNLFRSQWKGIFEVLEAIKDKLSKAGAYSCTFDKGNLIVRFHVLNFNDNMNPDNFIPVTIVINNMRATITLRHMSGDTYTHPMSDDDITTFTNSLVTHIIRQIPKSIDTLSG
jgi:hypothetical protein